MPVILLIIFLSLSACSDYYFDEDKKTLQKDCINDIYYNKEKNAIEADILCDYKASYPQINENDSCSAKLVLIDSFGDTFESEDVDICTEE